MTSSPSLGDSEKGAASSEATSQTDAIELLENNVVPGENQTQPENKRIKEDRSETVTAVAPASDENEKDPNLITWDGPSDSENPKNWSKRRRWTACVLISLYNFVGPLSSAICAPALPDIERDLNTTSTIGVMILSIYMLAFAVGPLFTSPLSEMYGRLVVLQYSNAFFFVFNTACGFVKTDGQMLAFRFLSGIGGCAAQSIGGGIMNDMFTPLERGKAVGIYSIAPLLGPVLGPVCGGLLTQYASWKWCFWIISIFDVAVQLAGLLYLRETYPPVLLRWKRNKLAKETGNTSLRTEFDGNRDWKRLLQQNMKRPFQMLGSQPIVQVLSLYVGYVYGLAFLVSATLPMVWEGLYKQTPAIASLNYLPGSVAVIVMSQITPRLGDIIYKRLIASSPDNTARPEFRIPLLFLGATMLPVGLLWYGWSAQEMLHPAMPNVGSAIFSAGTNVAFFCMNQYLIDTYRLHAASALAAATVLRGICGFCIPLFAPAMYNDLGFGVGNTILAAVAVAFGFPGAWLIWKWGPCLREKSQYVKK